MRRTHEYAAARARRILKGGAVTCVQRNARSWGRAGVTDVWKLHDSTHLQERLRAARTHGWTLDALLRDGSAWPMHAPYPPPV